MTSDHECDFTRRVSNRRGSDSGDIGVPVLVRLYLCVRVCLADHVTAMFACLCQSMDYLFICTRYNTIMTHAREKGPRHSQRNPAWNGVSCDVGRWFGFKLKVKRYNSGGFSNQTLFSLLKSLQSHRWGRLTNIISLSWTWISHQIRSFDECLDRQYDWSQFQPPVPQSLFDDVWSEMLYLRLLLLDLSEWLWLPRLVLIVRVCNTSSCCCLSKQGSALCSRKLSLRLNQIKS